MNTSPRRRWPFRGKLDGGTRDRDDWWMLQSGSYCLDYTIEWARADSDDLTEPSGPSLLGLVSL